ncbi:MAG TPA: wax ester/triacylglycerol synthase family O-acyltransferase [Stellaceae bacterium]|nr:wax ester/triacylglycerol synthase family O-acyltransferase [Stellaceae bacterium]
MSNGDGSGATRRLSLLDASFLYLESAVNPTHVGTIFILKDEIPFETVWRHVGERLHISPRFRQRLVFPPFNIARATIEDDPAFKLENHVRRHQLAKGSSDEEAIKEILRLHFGRVMDRSRPLWDITLFEGLPGRSLIVFAMHHAIIDGVSAVDLLNKLMDFTPNPPPVQLPAKPWAPASLPSPGEAYVNAVRDLIVGQLEAAASTAREFLRDPARAIEQARALAESTRLMNEQMQAPIVMTPWNAGLAVGDRSLTWLKMPFAEYRAIRTAFGGTINDVVLTVLTEGAARYLKHHGWPTEGNFRIGCPVNVRRPDEQIVLENRVSMMMPMMPARPMDLVERLQLITAETARIKASGAPYAMERVNNANDTIPPAVIAAASYANTRQMETLGRLIGASSWQPTPAGSPPTATGINFVATNVPGPQTPWYFGGHEVTECLGLLPLGGNLGYGVPIVSYNQNLVFSMIANSRMVPDLDRMKALVLESFEELRDRVPSDLRKSFASRPQSAAAA